MSYEIRKAKSFGLVFKTKSKDKAWKYYLANTGVQLVAYKEA